MGQEVEHREFTREDRTRFRAKVRRCLDTLASMLGDENFRVDVPHVGVEIELNLIDAEGRPALRNAEVLRVIADEDFQTELGLYNIEINVPPQPAAGDGLPTMERTLRDDLNQAQGKAESIDAHLVMVGILPTLGEEHFERDVISPNPRYRLLSDQILAARGEDIQIVIDGVDQLRTTSDTIMPEAACTSTQLHMQVEPDDFAPVWNAAQAIAGVQLAVGANSPFLLGHQLWHETRIPLFEQATDTRSEELKAQGVRPRVFFGERWITSVFDLFEENVRYFPALLPIVDDEDPAEELAAGRVPTLGELRLHNGTVYRWNRPIYDVSEGRPHLRIENRLLPAGPTVVDTFANAAFFYGLVTALAFDERPVWSQLSFAAAQDNFHAAARTGMESHLFWPGVGTVPSHELVLRHLLPSARDGLHAMGADEDTAGRLLDVVEKRCLTRRNGATWQIEQAGRLREGGLEETEVQRRLTLAYAERMHSNEPVHTWTVT